MKLVTKSILFCLIVLALTTHAAAQNSIWVSYFGKGIEAYERGDYVGAERMFRAAIDEAGKAAKAGDGDAVGMMSDSLSGLSGDRTIALGEPTNG
jgi:hypothetical protein